MNENSKILVTGGAGYIGSVVIEKLLRDHEPEDIVVIDDLSQGSEEALEKGVKFIKADFGNEEKLRETFSNYNIQAVIHLAAETVVEYSMTDPKRYFENNVVSGITLLDVMLENDVDKMIFSSSAAVYGDPEKTPILEHHSKNPVNSYGESKLMFEKILKWYYKAYNLKYIAFRYFNAAGATRKHGELREEKTHLIPIVLEVASGEKDKVEIFGTDYNTKDGTCIRDYIHVGDIAEAHLLALEKIDQIKNEVYNLGSEEDYSVKEVVEKCREVTGKEIKAIESGRRKGDPPVLVASARKAKKELNWTPEHQDLEEIIKSAWEWHKKL